jgi:hypothetical protein
VVVNTEENNVFLLTLKIERREKMAEKGKSKTDVSARADAKNRIQRCSCCGNKVEVVMTLSPTGKKKMKRLCCEG